MTIDQAIDAVSQEYNAECLRTEDDAAFASLFVEVFRVEYAEIDRELPGYVGEIMAVLGMGPGVLDPRLYQMARMCFRLGMRTQRKLDRPDQATTAFWRTDAVAQ
jgi:hypothetical protein